MKTSVVNLNGDWLMSCLGIVKWLRLETHVKKHQFQTLWLCWNLTGISNATFRHSIAWYIPQSYQNFIMLHNVSHRVININLVLLVQPCRVDTDLSHIRLCGSKRISKWSFKYQNPIPNWNDHWSPTTSLYILES